MEKYYPVEREDFNIYTELPTDHPEDYVKGYYYCLSIIKTSHVYACKSSLNSFVNIYATIQKSERVKRLAYTNLYVFFSNKYEHDLYAPWFENLSKKFNLDHTTSDDPVYFHKMHISTTYRPFYLSDPGERYRVYLMRYCKEHDIGYLEIPEEKRIEWRKECMAEKGCYIPQEGTYLCKKNSILCEKCILSVRYKDIKQYKYRIPRLNPKRKPKR